MAWLTELLGDFVPALIVIAMIVVTLTCLHWWLLARRKELGNEARLPRQLILAGVTLVGLLVLILALPISDTLRGQVLSFLGVLLTGGIGLSSTTFVANAMAGVMLRVVGQFRPGDFIRLQDQFGRVTERGLFHVEIQTEDRDLTTFPNLLLITHPLTVVHRAGTLVSAQVSLGYDIHRADVEAALSEAAEQVGLKDPFVQVVSLQDFSVLYRLAGSLEEVKHLLTVRSNLRKAMMDALHGRGFEIASPTLMLQRQLQPDAAIIPNTRHLLDDSGAALPDADAPEAKVFDKADDAEALEQARQRLTSLDAAADNPERVALEQQIADLEARLKAPTEAPDQAANPPG
ncbi:MAG: mechanosensitive ion channel protein MscS [Xanthomonadales bacterium]|nr:mechanosensitive ion channel protein MscS [Xanthomonadales bacterium]